MEGIAVRRPTTGAAAARRMTSEARPQAIGCRHSRSPQRANRGELAAVLFAQGSASRSSLASSLNSVTGSRVRVAASTKSTESMIPPAADRNEGDGTRSTADSETSMVPPDSRTALPAVSMVSATASRADLCTRAERYRTTRKSA